MQDFHLLQECPVGAAGDRRLTQLVQFRLFGIGDDVRVLHLADFFDLGIGEGGLRRAAPPKEIDLCDPALTQGFQRVIRDVRGREFFRGAAQDAGDVDRYVAHADHGGALLREIKMQVAVIRMAVVPRHEFGRRVAALQVLAGDAHASIRLRARRVQDLMVVLFEISQRQVLAELDVAVETEVGIGGDLLIRPGDGLDLGVIRGHSASDQPVGRRQAVEHIHLNVQAHLLEQVLGGVKGGRP